MSTPINLTRRKRTPQVQQRSKNAASSSRPRATRARPTNRKKKITPALLQEMTRRLVNEFDPEQVILFGSYAWGKPNQDSDVDLMVIVSESDETEYQRMVRGLHALRDKIVPTDVFIKTRAEFDRYKEVYASLECLIAEQGIVLYDQRTQKGIRPKLAHQSAK